MGIARQLETQQTHYLRKDVAYDTVGIASGVLIGTVPKGSKVTGVHVYIDTAFNAATTNVLTAGTTGTGTNLIAASDVTEGTAGYYAPADGTNQARGLAFAADTDLFVSYTQTGAAATAGAATVIVEYVPQSNGG
ncbi:hypothetical protein SAMN02927924_01428 [Sphingobium faniae]|nr:hypothetical protein SAMN02927924_01428 [Sphingobium faniae]